MIKAIKKWWKLRQLKEQMTQLDLLIRIFSGKENGYDTSEMDKDYWLSYYQDKYVRLYEEYHDLKQEKNL